MSQPDRYLEPNEAWNAIHENAKTSQASDATHNSPNHSREYRILDVTDSKVTIERTGRDGGKQKKPFTRNAVEKMVGILNAHPHGCARSTVHETYYFTNMLLELHPQIQLRGEQIVVVPMACPPEMSPLKT